jgi:hypothetical protein
VAQCQACSSWQNPSSWSCRQVGGASEDSRACG